jgi:hypothetical protein
MDVSFVAELTDQSFIIQGEDDDKKIISLKYDFTNNNFMISNTYHRSLPPNICVSKNSKQAFLISMNVHRFSVCYEIWQLPKDQEATAALISRAPILIEGNGETEIIPYVPFEDIKCLPGNLGFVFRQDNSLFLQLFNEERAIPLPVCSKSISSFALMQNGTVVYIDELATHAYEIPLGDFINDQVKMSNPRKRLHALYNTLPFFASPLIHLVDDYIDSSNHVLMTPTLEDCTRKLFTILNDADYFTGKCANEVRSLLKEKRSSTKLSELKAVFAKHQPHGIIYTTFGKDLRKEPKKMLSKIVADIDDFADLIVSTEFDKLQADWGQFHSKREIVQMKVK